MARFVFRLAPLLKMRERIEEQAKAALGKAIGIEEKERAVLRRLEEELQDSVADQRRARDGDIWVQGQILSMDWNARRKTEIAAQHTRILDAAAQVKEAQSLLVEARRGVQVLEKLRDRRKEQWRLEENRKELATLSDLAAQRWMRQQTEP